MTRWKVERAGSEGHWLPGWIAREMRPDGIGASFATQPEAFKFAEAQASSEAGLALRGLMKLASRMPRRGEFSDAR